MEPIGVGVKSVGAGQAHLSLGQSRTIQVKAGYIHGGAVYLWRTEPHLVGMLKNPGQRGEEMGERPRAFLGGSHVLLDVQSCLWV